MSQTVELLEFTRISKAREIDEEKGILYDLVILGPDSANGRHYPEETQRKALQLHEGRQSFANHVRKAGEEPSVYDVLGVWQSPHVRDGKTYGNFHYFKTHPLSARLVEAARRPELNSAFGFSINARGTEKRENGRAIIESIDSVRSIDLVGEPATVGGIYESTRRAVKKALKDIIESIKAKRPGYSKGLKEAAESGILSPDYQMEAPGEEPAGDEEVDHEQALLDAAKAVLDDGSLDTEAKLKKIRKILGIIDDDQDDEEEDEEVEDEDDDEDEEPPVKESKKAKGKKGGKGKVLNEAQLRRENAKLKAQALLRKAADEAGVKVPYAIVASVRTDLTEARAKEIVEAFKSGGSQPAKGGAKSGGGDISTAANAALRESQEGQRRQEKGGVPKFEGDKAQEQRLAYLRQIR